MSEWTLFRHKKAGRLPKDGERKWPAENCVVWARESNEVLEWEPLGPNVGDYGESPLLSTRDDAMEVRFPVNWAGHGSERPDKEGLSKPEQCAKTDSFPRGLFYRHFEKVE
jgi:hypothetical protein